MEEFLNKWIFLEIKLSDDGGKSFRHKCAKCTAITPTHISLWDSFDGRPYFYRIEDIIKIELTRNPNAKDFDEKVGK